MRVKEILKINDQLYNFSVKPPDNLPQVELTESPNLEDIFKAYRAFNIPYEVLTITEMQDVIRLIEKRYFQDNRFMQVLEILSDHLAEIENWSKN